MKAIEFQAQVKKGKIEIPPQFAEKITGQVRVIVWIEETGTTPDNFIEYLLAHPVPVKHLHPLSREEIYAE